MSDDNKDVEIKNLNDEADKIIKEHIGFAMVMGAIPIPIADIVAVSAVEVDMVHNLSKVYNVNYDHEMGKSVVTSIAGASIGVSLGWTATSALKAVPGVGTVLGIASQIILAGATTFALGKVFQMHFSESGTLADFDFEKVKEQFENFFHQGETVAQKMKEEQKKEDVFDTLEKLHKLHESGIISEDEYKKTKEELLKKVSE